MLNKYVGLVCISLLLIPFGAQSSPIDDNGLVPIDGSGETYISGIGFTNVKVTYLKQNGYAILGGDIVLGTVAQAESWLAEYNNASTTIGTQAYVIVGEHVRWENNLIPYEYDADVPAQTRTALQQAMDHWRANTTINFVARTPANAQYYPDYVRVHALSAGCNAQVGRVLGEQNMALSTNCGFGTSAHELGHVIGLLHEHTRPDRDQYVVINTDNIIPNKRQWFDIVDTGDYSRPYDYGSIMHYRRTDFGLPDPNSTNGGKLETITPIDPNANIGQYENGISALDIAAVVDIYPKINPIVNLDKTAYSVFLGNSLSLDASRSFAFTEVGYGLTYAWEFGDGSSDNTAAPTNNHLFTSRGKYNITVTVTDSAGDTGSDTVVAQVYGVQDILVPVLSLLL